MNRLILTLLIVFTFSTNANVNHITLDKITKDKILFEEFEQLKSNLKYYNHWTPQWNFTINKQDLIFQLENNYKSFSKIDSNNSENQLLLGTISHYLYNLDVKQYYNLAIKHYNFEIYKKSVDYRAYWFLGYHYSLSNNPNEAIRYFKKSIEILPKNENSDFWEDYAYATALANMPSNTIYAMDRIHSIKGEKGNFEQQLGESIRQRIQAIDKNNDYKKEEIWDAMDGSMITFISRPLGIKVFVDSNWDVSINDYIKGNTAFIINPTPILSVKGEEINYTIALILKTVDNNENLETYIDKFVSPYKNKKKCILTNKYDKMIAYEMIDSAMYEEMGGGHLYLLGIERDAPKYPGLLLESPINISNDSNNELSYYKAMECYNRFDGKIFYTILLDSCEDINEKSFFIFKNFLEKLLVIE